MINRKFYERSEGKKEQLLKMILNFLVQYVGMVVRKLLIKGLKSKSERVE